MILIREGMARREETWHGETSCASLLDSAPPDSSDDSGPVLTKPPSRLGETAFGDFGGKFLLHLSLGPPKLLGTSARLLIASAPLPGRPQDSIPKLRRSNSAFENQLRFVGRRKTSHSSGKRANWRFFFNSIAERAQSAGAFVQTCAPCKFRGLHPTPAGESVC